MSKAELKPCPFCGGEPEMVYAPTNAGIGIACWAVACKACRVMIGTTRYGVTDFYRSAEKAAEAWNRRMDREE